MPSIKNFTLAGMSEPHIKHSRSIHSDAWRYSLPLHVMEKGKSFASLPVQSSKYGTVSDTKLWRSTLGVS